MGEMPTINTDVHANTDTDVYDLVLQLWDEIKRFKCLCLPLRNSFYFSVFLRTGTLG